MDLFSPYLCRNITGCKQFLKRQTFTQACGFRQQDYVTFLLPCQTGTPGFKVVYSVSLEEKPGSSSHQDSWVAAGNTKQRNALLLAHTPGGGGIKGNICRKQLHIEYKSLSDKLLWWTLCSQAISLSLSPLSPRPPTVLLHSNSGRNSQWMHHHRIFLHSFRCCLRQALVSSIPPAQKIPGTHVDSHSFQNVGLFNICEREKKIHFTFFIFPYQGNIQLILLNSNRICCHKKNHLSVQAGRLTW